MKSGNIQIICCSTTSNYFHALRRQLNRSYRKPLIAFNSKKLLKFKGVRVRIFRLIDRSRISLRVRALLQSTPMLRLSQIRWRRFSSAMANFTTISRTEGSSSRGMYFSLYSGHCNHKNWASGSFPPWSHQKCHLEIWRQNFILLGSRITWELRCLELHLPQAQAAPQE